MTGGPRWCVGFDADDTLWHNERYFRLTHEIIARLLQDHAPAEVLGAHLEAVERRNLNRYGFGIKAFTLSMIETAVEITGGRVPGRVPGYVIGDILEAGREMLAHPVELLPGAQEAVAALAGEARLVLVTKGDLLDQERKLAASGLGGHFDAVEIVSDKTSETCARDFVDPSRSVMVGDSLLSDVLPPIAAGAWGVHVPQGEPWLHERAEPPQDQIRFRQIAALVELPGLLDRLN